MTAFAEYELDRTDGSNAVLAHYYAEVFGWPTTVDTDSGEVRLPLGEVVDALIIRAGLAAEVNHLLIQRMVQVPIIEVPGEPPGWIFLTRPRTTLRRSTWADLVRIQVGWKTVGESIPLPAHDGSGGVRWLKRPVAGTELPLWTAVVAAARSAASLGGAW